MKKTRAKKIAIILIIIIAMLSVSALIYAATVEKTSIVCEDNNLYIALKNRLSISQLAGESTDDATKTINISTEKVNAITELDLSNLQITNLTGLQQFTNLNSLNLSKNSITNLTPISTLTNLTVLNLNDTDINNASIISNYTKLKELYLSKAGITDISFVSGLTGLQTLDISENNISSLEPIQNLDNITKLDVAETQISTINNIISHRNLIDLDISGTNITSLDRIQGLSNLESLNVGKINATDITCITSTYKNGTKNIAYLLKLKKLDIRQTNNKITFTNLANLENLAELYMQGNNITTLSGIAKLQNLEYINLENNDIKDLSPMIQWKTVNGVREIDYKLNATQINLKDNDISDLSIFNYLNQNITHLNLAGNKISNIQPIEKYNFTQGIDLRNQQVEIGVYDKKANVNQYMILPNLLQSSKDSNSVAYAENASFETNGVSLNQQTIYQTAGNYNVIIDSSKTANDVLTVTLHGGIADGSLISYKISTKTTGIDSLLFVDENLDNAIYEYLVSHKKDTTYLARVPKILNITYSEIANVTTLDLSNHNIKDLTGLASFSKLANLNISQNPINTIQELESCISMKQLNVSNCPIKDNNSSIEKMTLLTSLDLSNTGMTNINVINTLVDYWINNKKAIQLKELNVSNNSLGNLDGIERITTLQKLYIANDKMSDISKLATLTNLNIFNMSGNQIEDISILSGLKSLTTLNISNNKIKDISKISNLSIAELDFSGNRVKDISSVSGMSSLTNLYMDNNQIEDITGVENLLIKNDFSAKQQRIVKALNENSSGNITIELPQIFKAAKEEGNKVYTEKEFELKNCSLSADGNHITVDVDQLGDKIAMISINGGKANATSLSIAAPLKSSIQYNITEKTNKDVVATINFNRGNVTILNNDGKNQYTFKENGTFDFEYMDEYGFGGITNASVDWIDKEGPEARVSKTITKDGVLVTVTSNEVITAPNGWTLDNNKLSISKIYKETANEKIQIADSLGNITELQIDVQIDNTPPTITGVENGKVYKTLVTPIVQDDNLDTVELTKDGVKVANYQSGNQIQEKGKYVLTAKDTYGNTTTISFEIQEVEVSDKITSNTYAINEEKLILRKVKPNTTANQIKTNINSNMSYQITDKNGITVAGNTKLGTGHQIKMDNGKKYTIVVWGDLNNDAVVNILDLAKLQKIILKMNPSTELITLAADLKEDNTLNLLDLAKLQKLATGQDIL